MASARILICSGVRGDTRRYRAVHLWEQTRLLGCDSMLVHLTGPGLEEQFRQHWDVVVLHRVALDRYVDRLLRLARAGGAQILYDIDDLVFDPDAFSYIDSPDFADPLRAALYRETMARFRAGLEASDGVLASTDYLAERARVLGKPVWVHRNAASLEMIKTAQAAFARKAAQPAPTEPRVVIGYASGTLTHNRDFAQIRPALQAVMARHPEVMLRLIGPLDPGQAWGGLAKRVQQLPPVPWRALPDQLAGFDINLAPLVLDNPFSQSKSEIKYMEAALVGVPTIASPTGAFAASIQAGETGLLAGPAAEWETALEHLVNDPALRQRLGRAAHGAVRLEYHPAARAGALQCTLAEVFHALDGSSFTLVPEETVQERAEAYLQQPDWIARPFERDPSNRELGLYSLRHRSVKTLAQQVWIFARRAAAPVFPFRRQQP